MTVRVIVELPGRILSEESTLDLPAGQTWDGPLGCADLVTETAMKVTDRLRLTLPEEWARLTGTLGRAARVVAKVADVVGRKSTDR